MGMPLRYLTELADGFVEAEVIGFGVVVEAVQQVGDIGGLLQVESLAFLGVLEERGRARRESITERGCRGNRTDSLVRSRPAFREGFRIDDYSPNG